MKQYLTQEQTAKLIELGFEKPRLLYFGNNTIGNYAYTIGELIEMLGVYLSSIGHIGIVYCVNARGIERRSEELIDALYDMIVKLKEEGVI